MIFHLTAAVLRNVDLSPDVAQQWRMQSSFPKFFCKNEHSMNKPSSFKMEDHHPFIKSVTNTSKTDVAMWCKTTSEMWVAPLTFWLSDFCALENAFHPTLIEEADVEIWRRFKGFVNIVNIVMNGVGWFVSALLTLFSMLTPPLIRIHFYLQLLLTHPTFASLKSQFNWDQERKSNEGEVMEALK